MNKFALALGLSTALVGMPVLAQSSAEWDTNSDQQIDRDEFSSGITQSGVFEDWDADGNGNLSREELRDGLYDQMDADQNQSVSTEEWNVHSDTFGSTYSDWAPEEEPDGFSIEEYNEAFESGSVYDQWDADSSDDVSEQEFSDAAFGAADRNIDGWISYDESEAFDQFWLIITQNSASDSQSAQPEGSDGGASESEATQSGNGGSEDDAEQ